jgi:heat shock protein HslJ
MRHAYVVLILCFFALPVHSREGAVTITWSDPAEPGSEALLLVRNEDGENSFSMRRPVEAGDTAAQIDLPPLPRTAQSVQAGLIIEGSVTLQSAIVPISNRTAPDLSLALHQSLAIGFSDLWECDDGQQMRITQESDDLTVYHPEGMLLLMAESDAAASFADEAGNVLRFSGNEAELILLGQPEVVCEPTLFKPVLPLEAVAAHGDWRIELGLETALIDLPGLDDETLPSDGLGISAPRNGAINVSARSLSLRLTQERCRLPDNTLIYPLSADLTLHATATRSRGCAGSALDLLSGRSWYVSSLFGSVLAPSDGEARAMTLQINNGQISGRGTCNRYVGRAEVEDGRLAFQELGTTRLACPTDLRNLELRFLDALEVATGFDISRDGMLILRSGPMPILTAIRR